ncbi:MAG TPA: hypothetical protein VK809_07180, partial [Bacteroidia bacterium]|nr:hypothetical protein [Bacteroidia bacterium]
EFNFQKILEEERKYSPGVADFTARLSTNQPVNKCFIGEAVLLSPFFLIAYTLSHLLGYDTGGYGLLFQVFVSIGALFYLAFGLIYLRKLIKLYTVSEFATGLTIILVVFATNLFNYATIEPSMSHVYSFGFMAFFLFHLKKSIDEFKTKNLLWLTVAITILVLIRPTNLLGIFFIPFFAGSIKNSISFIVKFFKNKNILVFFLVAGAILSIQFIIWYAETGRFFIWSYPGEGFNFLRPRYIYILFSYCKGWFLYTPLMLMTLLGGFFTYRRNRFLFLSVLFFFLLITYVLSSWSSWWYGGSFGLRAFIDFYPAFALLLAITLDSFTSLWLQVPFTIGCFMCLYLNQVQTYQYTHSILPIDSMNKNRYWKIFLKTDHAYVGIFENLNTDNYNYFTRYYFSNDFEHNTWGYNDNISTNFAQSGTHSAFVDQQHQYSPALVLKASELPQAKPLYIYVKVWVYMPDFNNDAEIVASLQDDKGACLLWRTRFLQGFVFERNLWTQAYALIKLPELNNPDDVLKVYVLNTKNIVYIDNMEVTFGTPK